MSRSTNREYSSTDISTVTGYKMTGRISKASGAGQPLFAYWSSDNRSKKCESQQDSISEVTINNTIYSDKTTPKRRVIPCKDTNDEEMITYHLKLKPESLRFTFSTTEPKRRVYTDNHSDYQGTSGLACPNIKKELPSHESSFSQNHQHENSRGKSYEEKTTNCRPVINMHTVEFIERTIDKNNRLKRLVKDIVEAREKEKQLEAWNNYINELKNKHANINHGPEKNQVECDNIFDHYNKPCRCTSFRPGLSVNDEYSDVSKQSDYLVNFYPNEISCYPISSEAHRSKNKTNKSPRRQYVKTEYIINAEEEYPRKRKRRQLSNNQLRNISAQTSTGIGTSSNDNNGRNQTRNVTKDEIEGYEPCACAAESVRDSGTSTVKFEQETLTEFKKHASSQSCFCNKDQDIIVTNNEKQQHKLEKSATYETVTEKNNKLKGEIVQSQTRNVTKDEIEGYEPCVCAVESVRDFGTSAVKFEQETLTEFKKHASSQSCFCNKDHDIKVTNNEKQQQKLEKSPTYETVTEKINKLKGELVQSRTCDNSLGIIEEKLDNIISTMNDLLSEVKLRITDMSTEKFDTATSTLFPHINEKYENCIAYKLLEQEIKTRDLDNAKQKETYNFELFNRDHETINTAQLNPMPTNFEQFNYIPKSTETTTQLNSIPKSSENESQLGMVSLLATPISSEYISQLDVIPTQEQNTTQLNATPETTEKAPQLKYIITTSENKKLDVITIPTDDTAQINATTVPVNYTDVNTKNLGDHTTPTLAESNKEAEVAEKHEKKILRLAQDPTISLIRTLSKDNLVSNVDKTDGETNFDGHPQSATSSQAKDNESYNVERSVIDLKKASKSFMDTLYRSGPNLTEDEMNKKSESFGQRLKAKFSSKAHHAKNSKEQKATVRSTPEDNSAEENRDLNHSGNKRNSKKKRKDQEFCCVYANFKSIPHSHGSVRASSDKEISNATALGVYYSNNDGNDQIINKRQCALVDRAVSKINENIVMTNGKSNNTKLRITVDRAVSKIDDNFFREDHRRNYIFVDRAVSKIDDIIKEEINKSNQAKKDINEILSRDFTNDNSVQIKFELPTKERGTEVTDSLSKTRVSNTSSSQRKNYYGRPSRRTPLTIAAVNTDPMSLFGLFRLSTNTMRQLLTFINFDYSSFLPSVSQAMPTVSEAVQYLCHICGAAFRRPSDLSNHMKSHNLESAKDCCVCRHILQLRENSPGVFTCRFCGQCYTRAYCCQLHERSCSRRCGRELDVSDSRAILT